MPVPKYSNDVPKVTSYRESLKSIYAEHRGKVSDKWSIYLDEYDRLFQHYRDEPIRLLEIGIQNGGSLEIWSKFFSKAEKLVGSDINPACMELQFEDPRIGVVVADANTDEAEQRILELSGHFDVIVDDGSHQSRDIVRSFARYFKHLNDGGLYVTEDLHCSYWQDFEGGIFQPYSSIAFFKRLADTVNHEHWGIDKTRSEILRSFDRKYDTRLDEVVLAHIHSIEFVNSMCIIKKARPAENALGTRIVTGTLALVEQRVLPLNGSRSAQPNQSTNPWSTRYLPIEEELVLRIQEISSLHQTDAEREQAHLIKLAQTHREVETQLRASVECERASAQQLQAIQQAHAKQQVEQSREYAERKQVYHLQLAQARQQAESHLIALAEREKAFSQQLQGVQLAHDQQKQEQSRAHAAREQIHLADLAQARQQAESQMHALTEREKAFSKQLQSMRMAHDQQKQEQSRAYATRQEELNAQIFFREEQLSNLTRRWAESENAYALVLSELQCEIDALRKIYSISTPKKTHGLTSTLVNEIE